MKHLLLITFLCYSFAVKGQTSAFQHIIPSYTETNYRFPVRAGDLLTAELQVRQVGSGLNQKFLGVMAGTLGVGVLYAGLPSSGEHSSARGVQINTVAFPSLLIRNKRSKASLYIRLYDTAGKLREFSSSEVKVSKKSQSLRTQIQSTADGYAEVVLSNEGKKSIIESGLHVNFRRASRTFSKKPEVKAFFVLPPGGPNTECSTWWAACDCWTECDPYGTGGTFETPVEITAPAPSTGSSGGNNSSGGSGGSGGNGSSGNGSGSGTSGGNGNSGNTDMTPGLKPKSQTCDVLKGLWESSLGTNPDGSKYAEMEHGAIITDQGIIVLPTCGVKHSTNQYDCNGFNKNNWDFLPGYFVSVDGVLHYKWNGVNYKVLGTIHTHPSTVIGNALEASDKDKEVAGIIPTVAHYILSAQGITRYNQTGLGDSKCAYIKVMNCECLFY